MDALIEFILLTVYALTVSTILVLLIASGQVGDSAGGGLSGPIDDERLI